MKSYLLKLGIQAKKASSETIVSKKKDQVLTDYCNLIIKNQSNIIKENQKDIVRAKKKKIKRKYSQ